MSDPLRRQPSFPFAASMRMQHAREFQRVFASKVFAADDLLVIHGCRNGLESDRLGLSIGRSVGNAVTRNRWKRRIREAFRLHRTELPGGLDLVVRPKRGAVPDFERIRKSLPRLAALVAKRCQRATE